MLTLKVMATQNRGSNEPVMLSLVTKTSNPQLAEFGFHFKSQQYKISTLKKKIFFNPSTRLEEEVSNSCRADLDNDLFSNHIVNEVYLIGSTTKSV